MPAQNAPRPIIIRRKAKHGGGHHGGAWKVAFADFVTAMMALFIVLWLVSSSEQVKKAVGGYFNDPTGTGKEIASGMKGIGNESLSVRKEDMDQLKDKLEQAVKSTAGLEKIKEHVVFTVTGEGLRVELLEGERDTFFESASARPTEVGKGLLKALAQEIGKLPNKVVMEGHTDSRKFAGQAEYSNWELSADRANAARRWMRENGMPEEQVAQVRGFADHNLRDPAHPEDGGNRRVTLIIQYQPGRQSAPKEPASESH